MPGTNAVYTFKNAKGDNRDVHVYDNCDAYPSGAAEKLLEAVTMGEVARAICPSIRAGSRLSAVATEHAVGDEPNSLEQLVFTPSWQEGPGTNFRYEIEQRGEEIHVSAFVPDVEKLPPDFQLRPEENFPEWKAIFEGSLEAFLEWAQDKDYLGDYGAA